MIPLIRGDPVQERTDYPLTWSRSVSVSCVCQVCTLTFQILETNTLPKNCRCAAGNSETCMKSEHL